MDETLTASRLMPRALLHRHLRTFLSALLMLVTSTALASEPCQPFEGGRVDAQPLEVMRNAAREGHMYRVVPGKSRVGFCIRHFPGQEFRGEYPNVVGGLAMPSLKRRYGQALLLVHTSMLDASNEEFTSLVQSHKFMDTSRYPEALFVGRAFEWLTPLQGYIYGDLTLRGETQPVVFQVSIEILEEGLGNIADRIFLKGTGQVNRYEFNMRSYRLTVSENVRLCLEVEMVPWDS